MCGIWALFGQDTKSVCEIPNFFRISHRGPDAFRLENVPKYQPYIVGFHRLAISDPTQGMQPLQLESLDHLWLLFNGEIYNSEKIKEEYNFTYETDMDGECILHLYNSFGIEAAAKSLDGTFAICLIDTKKSEIHLIRDTFGVRSLYRICTEEGYLAVSSEAKGIINVNYGKSATGRINQFLPGHIESYDINDDCTVILKETTIFATVGEEPIYKSVVTTDASSYFLNEGSSEDNICNNLKKLVMASVERRVESSSRKIGCLLSGGVASSIISALVVKEAKEQGATYPVQTFSVGFEGSVDLMYARKVAKYIGSEHHEVIITEEDFVNVIAQTVYYVESYDVNTIRNATAMYLICRYVRDTSKDVVLFTGDGLAILSQSLIDFRTTSSKEADALCKKELEDAYLYGLQRTDKICYAWGLEASLPFYDPEFVSYFLSLDQELRHTAVSSKQPATGGNDGVTEHVKAKYFMEVNDDTVEVDTEIHTTYVIGSNGLQKVSGNKPKIHKAKQHGRSKKPAIDEGGTLVEKAFSELVPDAVMNRPHKEFALGMLPVDETWENYMGAYFKAQVSDVQMKMASQKYPYNTPTTREGYAYRDAFEALYPGRAYWLPSN